MPKVPYSRVIEEDPRQLKELEKTIATLTSSRGSGCLGYSSPRSAPTWGGRRGVGLQLASVPEMVRNLQKGWAQGAAQEQGERARPPGVGHARGLRGPGGGHQARGDRHGVGRAHEFLGDRHGIEYSHPDGVGQLLRRRKVKLKTGRPRHEKADHREQEEAFKKLRRRGPPKLRSSSSPGPREAAEGFGLRRSPFLGLINWQ
jgi:hypothetical protein